MEASDNQDLFSNFKRYLLLFEYPLIRGMDDEQIADIFKSPNRCFLICWMLKALDPSYETKLTKFENNPEFLGNILYELGFCTLSKGLPFITGQLHIKEQLTILLSIFKCMNNVTQLKVDEDESKINKCVTNDDILNLKTLNLNIFPMYGAIRTAKKVERSTDEKDKIIICVENLEEYNKCNVEESLEEFNGMLKKVTENFQQFQGISKMLVQDENIQCESDIIVHPEFSDILINCHACLQKMLQYFEDISTIQNFYYSQAVDDFSTKNDRTELKEAFSMLKKEFSVIAELSNN